MKMLITMKSRLMLTILESFSNKFNNNKSKLVGHTRNRKPLRYSLTKIKFPTQKL